MQSVFTTRKTTRALVWQEVPCQWNLLEVLAGQLSTFQNDRFPVTRVGQAILCQMAATTEPVLVNSVLYVLRQITSQPLPNNGACHLCFLLF